MARAGGSLRSGGRCIPLLAAALALLAGLALPGVASAAPQAGLFNPCRFAESDSPCEVENGVYRALVPKRAGPHPAVVYLYGSLGRSRRVTDSAFFRHMIVRRGYALIVPAALNVRYRGGRKGTGWGRLARRADHPRDDLAFLQEVIADADRRFNIDPGRILFVGQSDGGFMIYEIACFRPELGAAFAVHAAGFAAPLLERCKRPVRFMHTHGRKDKRVPFPSGVNRRGAMLASNMEDTLEMFSRTNRCGANPDRPLRFYGFERYRWQDCARGSALDLLLHDGGHDWPAEWMRAVLEWFEETAEVPAEAARRRPGDDGPVRLRRAPDGEAGGRFTPVPSDD